MILAVAATPLEMKPFLDILLEEEVSCRCLVTGVGPLETAVRLTKYFCTTDDGITSVLNFGVGGAYIQSGNVPQPEVLDICLARKEVLGDLGICYRDELERLDGMETEDVVYHLDSSLLATNRYVLQKADIQAHVGTFVTVNATSGTLARGEMLHSQWQGICENMEGAAVARVCRQFDIPCAAMRCISNKVEDRNFAKWRLSVACAQAARAAMLIVKGAST